MPEAWHERERLYELYVEQGLTQAEVADLLDTTQTTISKWLRRHEIETDEAAHERDYSGANSPRYVPYARFETDGSGYEVWRSRADGRANVGVHRLAAVAWHGYEAVAGNDVHHSNGVPWDNRESNLELLDGREHRETHAVEQERDDRGRFA